MLRRILASLALIISFIFLPFWITLILGLVFLYFFRNYWEVVPIFFFADLVYGIPQPRFGNFEYALTLFAIVLFFAVQILKNNLIKTPTV